MLEIDLCIFAILKSNFHSTITIGSVNKTKYVSGPLLVWVRRVQLHPPILDTGCMHLSIFRALLLSQFFVYFLLLMSKSCTHQLKYLTLKKNIQCNSLPSFLTASLLRGSSRYFVIRGHNFNNCTKAKLTVVANFLLVF